MTIQIPQNFDLFNQSNTKNLVVVFRIDGLNDIISSAPVGTRLRYGDPAHYGDAGLVYGGIRPWVGPNGGVVEQLLELSSSSLQITQTVEPEAGKASISQLSATFIDKNSYMTQLVSPGIKIPEILGAEVKVYIGYQEISYPEDYLLVFRGIVQTVQTQPGLVTLQLGDPNLKRRQNIFFTAKTTLTSPINNSVTTIPVGTTNQFHKPIQGPAGTFDSDIKCYLIIDSEVISYTAASFGVNQFTSVTRGDRGTVAASHSSGATVQAAIEVGNSSTGINPLDLALKLMLSGWDGPYISNVSISSIGWAGGVVVANSIQLLPTVDAVLDLGLSAGDYITISGDSIPANNATFIVQSFQDNGSYPNNTIIVDGPLTTSTNSPAVLALRSQYDTFPLTCGCQMAPWEVDVATHKALRASIINSTNENLSFYITSEESSAKTFIESEVYLPITAYSVTRQGQCSLNITLPPIANQTLVTLDKTNVVHPENISVQRGTTNRNFFNEVDWQYDPDDAGNFKFELDSVDSTSLSRIGLSSVLPITSRGLRNSISGSTIVSQRSERFLNRFKNGAILIQLQTNFQAINTLSPGDMVILKDNGDLQIPNFSTGVRNLGSALYEVRNRSIDIKGGQGSLQLLSNNNFTTQDRFATWAPSSQCKDGGTTTSVPIQPYPTLPGAVPPINPVVDFGTPGNEYKKWLNYVGATLVFHSYDWTQSSTAVLSSVSTSNVLTLATALSFTPDKTTLVDFDSYPSSTDPTFQALEKQMHCFFDHSVVITSGVNATSFHVGAGDVPYFIVGFPIVVHTPTWSQNSSGTTPSLVVDGVIESVVGTLVTFTNPNSALYTPVTGDIVEILSFADGQVGYRFV